MTPGRVRDQLDRRRCILSMIIDDLLSDGVFTRQELLRHKLDTGDCTFKGVRSRLEAIVDEIRKRGEDYYAITVDFPSPEGPYAHDPQTQGCDLTNGDFYFPT